MTRRVGLWSMLVFLVSALLMAGASTGASAGGPKALYEQSNVVRGPDTGFDCTGDDHGRSTITEQDDGSILVEVKLEKGPANSLYEVFWTCTDVARGCHIDACGFVHLGTFTTDKKGKGKFKAELPAGNPFPGSYVHIDLLNGELYTSVFGAIPE